MTITVSISMSVNPRLFDVENIIAIGVPGSHCYKEAWRCGPVTIGAVAHDNHVGVGETIVADDPVVIGVTLMRYGSPTDPSMCRSKSRW